MKSMRCRLADSRSLSGIGYRFRLHPDLSKESRMDIRQLKYFIAVAEERNISHAAARLNISQPPLTRHIQSLEEELGVQLLTRTNWGVELTKAGESLLNHARNIKTHIELATEQVRRAGSGQEGRIDIGIFGSAMLNIIPLILNDFVETHPDVKVVLHSAPRGQQIEALHQGRILIAFDRYLPESTELQIELVGREPILVALNQRNHLSTQQTIDIEDLRNEPLIGEKDSSVFSAAQALFRHHGFEPLIVQKAVDMISAAVMVAGGFGSALVPESVQNLQLPNVVYRPLVSEVDSLINLHCAYRKDEQSPLLAALLEKVHAYRTRNQVASQLALKTPPEQDAS
ncbi:MAG: LysR family transcriptional regulator [Formivibrio sp.]|nr:LysR family transcriptional regulator [Formivibrio sp.]